MKHLLLLVLTVTLVSGAALPRSWDKSKTLYENMPRRMQKVLSLAANLRNFLNDEDVSNTLSSIVDELSQKIENVFNCGQKRLFTNLSDSTTYFGSMIGNLRGGAPMNSMADLFDLSQYNPLAIFMQLVPSRDSRAFSARTSSEVRALLQDTVANCIPADEAKKFEDDFKLIGDRFTQYFKGTDTTA